MNKQNKTTEEEVRYIPNNLLDTYVKDISDSYIEMTEEEQKSLWNDKEKNCEKIINSQLRLVISIVQKIAPSEFKRNDCIMDLIQAGNLGLMKAYQKFDPKMNIKFDTYAYHWIETYVNSELTNQRCGNLKKPQEVLRCFYTVSKIENYFSRLFRRMPSDSEIATMLDGIFPSFTVEEILRMMRANVISLDTPIDDDGKTIEDFIADGDDFTKKYDYREGETPEDRIRKEIQKALKPRLFLLICARYGLGEYDGKQKKLDEIAQIFVEKGFNDTILSTERVRQLENKALQILKENPKILNLFQKLKGEF